MDEEVIIRPLRGKRDPRVAFDHVMAMTPSALNFFTDSCRVQQVPGFDSHFYGLYRPEDGSLNPFNLSGPYLGAPQAVLAMEKMIALGAARFWVMGYCGSLQKNLGIGDTVIPTGAVSEEGTSKHYFTERRETSTDRDLNRSLEKALHKNGIPFKKGAVWSTDAPYRETVSKVRHYQEGGILAVDMEMSALMTVAAYRNVRLSGLLLVSDELSDLSWNPGFSSPQLRKNLGSAGNILLEVIRSLNPNVNL
jgi:purine-nucleoside phosphorylase